MAAEEERRNTMASMEAETLSKRAAVDAEAREQRLRQIKLYEVCSWCVSEGSCTACSLWCLYSNFTFTASTAPHPHPTHILVFVGRTQGLSRAAASPPGSRGRASRG